MASDAAPSDLPADSTPEHLPAGSALPAQTAKPVVISVRKGRHEYHFHADSDLAALRALLQTADSGNYNLTRRDVIPYIDYLGYTLDQVERSLSSRRRLTSLPPQAA
ncbi:MAG: hypothetical protein ACREJ2_00485 [Planctomycetota bacterium]